MDYCILQLQHTVHAASAISFLAVYGIYSGIENDNETGITSNVLGESLHIFGTIISILNFSPKIPLTKEFLFVIIEALIVYRNVHKPTVLHASPFKREKKTVTSCSFNTKGFLYVMVVVTSTPNLNFYLYFTLSTPLTLNGYTTSRSFKYAKFNTKLG